jgi:molybdopterin-containing oxidoreductase family membrane subunit
LIGATFLVKGKTRGEIYNLLYVFNTMYAWLSLIVFISFIIELFLAWYGQNPYEWYAFKDQSAPLNLKRFYLKFLVVSIVPFIFFGRKVRINRGITIVVLIITNASYWLAYIKRFFIEYLSSSWSTYYEDPLIEKIAMTFSFLVLFASVYWIALKRKNLPYPSLILINRV